MEQLQCYNWVSNSEWNNAKQDETEQNAKYRIKIPFHWILYDEKKNPFHCLKNE